MLDMTHPNFKHGHAKSVGKNGQPDLRTPAYRSWDAMKDRCLNPRSKDYHRYGGAGVKIHPEWVDDFAAFFRHIGPRPKGTSLDRYPDNAGDYVPGNVRWATPRQQTRNLRTNRLLMVNGETRCMSEWCELRGLPVNTVFMRLESGWSAERAIETPVRTQLTYAEAIRLRDDVRGGMKVKDAARKYIVSRATVWAIMSGRANWSKLPP